MVGLDTPYPPLSVTMDEYWGTDTLSWGCRWSPFYAVLGGRNSNSNAAEYREVLNSKHAAERGPMFQDNDYGIPGGHNF
jgi:hypothetical protein